MPTTPGPSLQLSNSRIFGARVGGRHPCSYEFRSQLSNYEKYRGGGWWASPPQLSNSRNFGVGGGGRYPRGSSATLLGAEDGGVATAGVTPTTPGPSPQLSNYENFEAEGGGRHPCGSSTTLLGAKEGGVAAAGVTPTTLGLSPQL